jgi:hypothetical protein
MSDGRKKIVGVFKEIGKGILGTVVLAVVAFLAYGLFRSIPDIVKGISRAAGVVKKAAVDGWEEGAR